MLSKVTLLRIAVLLGCASPLGVSLVACGSDAVTNPDYGSLPDAALFNPGQGSSGSGYGSGSGQSSSGGTAPIYDAGPPQCADSLKLCPQEFTYPYNGETSVLLRGNYNPTAWTGGNPMTHTGNLWTVTVPVPWDVPVEYKFFVNGTTWVTDPTAPTAADDAGDVNNVKAAITCPNTYTCGQQGALATGVFDWRDAVIYFVFIDRFLDGNKSNNCGVSGTTSAEYTSANYVGGDWAGVTQQITSGYFKTLGVNTLWITVPVQNADKILGAGEACNNGSCAPDSYEYSAYHGYWPLDPTSVEPCFGTPADLHALIAAAHAANLKVLFDYAMVDIHTSSPVFTANPSWFTPPCQCGDTNNGCGNYNDYKCWFTPYLAHFDFTNSSAALNYSVNAALNLVQTYGNDAFRLDAIKQVDPKWLASLRPQVANLEAQVADAGPLQHFYMVGETYDFDDMGYIRSFIDTTNGLDGQFDFPLRYRLVDALLLRDTAPMLDPAIPDGQNWTFNQPGGMQGLAAFMDYNDAFYAPTNAIMSTFIGNHDLPRSIHYAEQTLPSWLGSNAQDALTTNGQASAWTGAPTTEGDTPTYERLANAFAVIFTNKGAPLLYYGDEIGLPGAGDPDNRRTMTFTGWSTAQQGLHDRIAALLAIRAAHPAMRRGTRATVGTTSLDLWTYELTSPSDNDTVYVGINRSDGDLTSTAIPAGLPELLAGGTSTATVTIPARQTRIWSSSTPQSDAGADGG